MSKVHFYARFLEFAEARSFDGFTHDDFNKWAESNGFTKTEIDLCSRYIHELCDRFDFIAPGKNFITPETYFNYIDYVELREARKNSKEAFWLSFIAIIISLISVGWSVLGRVDLQKGTTIHISTESIEAISKAIKK